MSRAASIIRQFNESKKDEVISFIKSQINFDITPYIDAKNSTNRYLNLDFDKIPKNIQNEIKRLATSYGKKNYRLESNGGLGTALIFEAKTYDIENVADFLANSLEHSNKPERDLAYASLGLDTRQSMLLISAWYKIDPKERLKLSMNSKNFYAWIKKEIGY